MISHKEEFEALKEFEYIRAEKDWEEREALREMYQLPAKIIVEGLKDKEEINESIISKISGDNKEGILSR